MKPLIILGNGKSLEEIDLSTLSTQDCFGMNGAYIKFQEIQWFPKYYGGFVKGPNKWNDLIPFVEQYSSKFEKLFFIKKFAKDLLPKRDNIVLINQQLPDELNIDGTKFALPEQFDNSETDLPRYKVSWVPPKSFDNFYSTGGVAGVTACLIGLLLGYKRLILLGMDANWTINTQNTVDTQNTYWFKNYFNNIDYNLAEFCPECTAESIQKMHLDSWKNLSEMIQVNNLDIEIINATKNSKIDCFPIIPLEDLLL